jgi:uncharacterized membrane protein YhaH (DUF805 family)
VNAQNPYESPTTAPGTHSNAATPLTAQSLFSFSGRFPRRVYWGVSIVAGIINAILGQVVGAVFGQESATGAIVALIVAIPLIWVGVATTVKRWHDRNKSGWWILIAFIPIVGWIWSFVEAGCLRGTVGPNNYGADPT